MCTMNSAYRIAATLYSLETWFVSGICVNTLHKGDGDDDDDHHHHHHKRNIGPVGKIIKFQTSVAVKMRSLFWNVTQLRLAVTYVSGQRIGPIFKDQVVLVLYSGYEEYRVNLLHLLQDVQWRHDDSTRNVHIWTLTKQID